MFYILPHLACFKYKLYNNIDILFMLGNKKCTGL